MSAEDILKAHTEQMAAIGREGVEKTREYSDLQGRVIRRLLHPLAKLVIPKDEGEPKQGEMIS